MDILSRLFEAAPSESRRLADSLTGRTGLGLGLAYDERRFGPFALAHRRGCYCMLLYVCYAVLKRPDARLGMRQLKAETRSSNGGSRMGRLSFTCASQHKSHAVGPTKAVIYPRRQALHLQLARECDAEREWSYQCLIPTAGEQMSGWTVGEIRRSNAGSDGHGDPLIYRAAVGEIRSTCIIQMRGGGHDHGQSLWRGRRRRQPAGLEQHITSDQRGLSQPATMPWPLRQPLFRGRLPSAIYASLRGLQGPPMSPSPKRPYPPRAVLHLSSRRRLSVVSQPADMAEGGPTVSLSTEH